MVGSYQEHQSLLQQREEEKKNGEELKRQNEQLQQNLPHQDRRRAAN